MGNAFTSSNIKEIFFNRFEALFNEFNQIVHSKGVIKDENGINQFKNDIFFIKKVMTILDLIECDKFNLILEKCIMDVKPNKNI